MIKRMLSVTCAMAVGCTPMTIVQTTNQVKPIEPVIVTWQPAKPYFGESDKLLYGLSREEYNKLVLFMNDTNRFIQSYKLDSSHERLEDLGDLMFEYDQER